MSFANRIKAAREAKSLSQKELAKMLNITDGTISNYEKNVAFPRWDKIIKLCDILEIDPNYLFWDDLSDKIREKIKKDTSIADGATDHENKVLNAYRSHPEMQPAINKMLDIEKTEFSVFDDIAAELECDIKRVRINTK